MNKQRKVLITTTYNEMGIVIDTKAEEVAQPEILACGEGELNVPDTNVGDTISRQAAIDAFWELDVELRPSAIDAITGMLKELPSAQPEIIRCKDCKYFVSDMEWCEADDEHPAEPDAFCSWAERRDG